MRPDATTSRSSREEAPFRQLAVSLVHVAPRLDCRRARALCSGFSVAITGRVVSSYLIGFGWFSRLRRSTSFGFGGRNMLGIPQILLVSKVVILGFIEVCVTRHT